MHCTNDLTQCSTYDWSGAIQSQCADIVLFILNPSTMSWVTCNNPRGNPSVQCLKGCITCTNGRGNVLFVLLQGEARSHQHLFKHSRRMFEPSLAAEPIRPVEDTCRPPHNADLGYLFWPWNPKNPGPSFDNKAAHEHWSKQDLHQHQHQHLHQTL